MESSQAVPAGFAELWEQLGLAHTHEVSELREENFRMRCRLACAQHEYPCCGTFKDKDGRTITVSAVGDSIVVAFPVQQAQLAEGNLNVFGITGKYKDGLLVWDNGDRWSKTLDTSSQPRGEDPETEGNAETNDGGSRSRLEPHDGDVDEHHPGRHEVTDDEVLGGELADTATETSHEHGRRKTTKRPPVDEAVGRVLNTIVRQHHEKETLPFSRHTTVRRGGTMSCSAYLLLEWFVRSRWFEACVWVLIMASAIVMAAELQYEGLKIGFELRYDDSLRNAEHQYPGAADVFRVLEWVFGVSFSVYLILKILVLRLEFLCGKERLWNVSDLVIVVLWWIWQVDQIGKKSSFQVNINPQLLRVFRVSRLIRHLKMVRQFMTFDALHVMTTALQGSLHVFVWAMMLLCLFQTVMALLLTSTIQDLYLDVETNDISERREVYNYFGTFSRTFLTMFELSLANWPVPSRILTENISEWWTAFAILHKLTIGFALVGIINGVFMQETFKVAAADDRIMLRQKQVAGQMHARKMRALFKHLDTSHDGRVDVKEFRQIVHDKEVKDWLAAQDLNVTDADSVFKLIAGQGNDEITSDDLIAGLGRLKGNVRTLDFMLLRQQMSENRDIFRKVAGLAPESEK